MLPVSRDIDSDHMKLQKTEAPGSTFILAVTLCDLVSNSHGKKRHGYLCNMTLLCKILFIVAYG